MKIYYKSKIAKLFTFIDGYKTIMLFGAVFTERDSISLIFILMILSLYLFDYVC